MFTNLYQNVNVMLQMQLTDKNIHGQMEIKILDMFLIVLHLKACLQSNESCSIQLCPSPQTSILLLHAFKILFQYENLCFWIIYFNMETVFLDSKLLTSEAEKQPCL
jgi:hypothetical protein